MDNIVVPGTVYLTFLEKERHLIHRHVRTCCPLGEDAFVENLQQVLGRSLRPQKPEPKWRWMRVKYTVPGIPWGTATPEGIATQAGSRPVAFFVT